MGVEDVKKSAEGLADKAKEFARTTLTDEATTDSVLDAASGVASKVTGGKFDDKIHAAREAADAKVGSD